MSKKDYFKLALVEVLRSVKRVYIFIILICTILTLGLFIFNHNINKMVNIISTKEIGYRSLSVIPRFINGEYDLDKDVEDLARLNHVIDVFYGLEGINETETNIRSNEFLTYVSENNINNIKRVCVKEFCDTLRGSSLEKSFAIFSEKYKKYLKETKGEEIALETSLKGFIITKIETLS